MDEGFHNIIIRADAPSMERLLEYVSKVLTDDKDNGMFVQPGTLQPNPFVLASENSQHVTVTIRNDSSDKSFEAMRRWAEKRFTNMPDPDIKNPKVLKPMNGSE